MISNDWTSPNLQASELEGRVPVKLRLVLSFQFQNNVNNKALGGLKAMHTHGQPTYLSDKASF